MHARIVLIDLGWLTTNGSSSRSSNPPYSGTFSLI